MKDVLLESISEIGCDLLLSVFPSWAVVADANGQGVHAQQHGRFCV